MLNDSELLRKVSSGLVTLKKVGNLTPPSENMREK
jgi:hypothetical protein